MLDSNAGWTGSEANVLTLHGYLRSRQFFNDHGGTVRQNYTSCLNTKQTNNGHAHLYVNTRTGRGVKYLQIVLYCTLTYSWLRMLQGNHTNNIL